MALCLQPECGNEIYQQPQQSCTHSLSLCAEHTGAHIHTFISRGESDVKCPESRNGCPGTLSTKSIAQFIKPADEPQFFRQTVQITKDKHPGRTNCPHCGYLIFHIGGDETPIVHCAYCNHVFCHKHRVIWEDGHNCDTYEIFQAGSNMHGCPKCKVLMTRVSGCNYMRCGEFFRETDCLLRTRRSEIFVKKRLALLSFAGSA